MISPKARRFNRKTSNCATRCMAFCWRSSAWSKKHRENLLHRGFTASEIRAAGIRFHSARIHTLPVLRFLASTGRRSSGKFRDSRYSDNGLGLRSRHSQGRDAHPNQNASRDDLRHKNRLDWPPIVDGKPKGKIQALSCRNGYGPSAGPTCSREHRARFRSVKNSGSSKASLRPTCQRFAPEFRPCRSPEASSWKPAVKLLFRLADQTVSGARSTLTHGGTGT